MISVQEVLFGVLTKARRSSVRGGGAGRAGRISGANIGWRAGY